ncbi:MAG: dephospho-CoA kinase [Treponema sp.]|nr:dephospho-CoA kinase [Treponema sp.]
MLIGLTGKYCSGKNYVAALLERRGFPVLDIDKQGHIAIENKKTEILTHFGKDLQNQDGSINRRLLGEKVFGKEDALSALEAIVHPEANRLALEWIAAQNGKPCVINAALLHKFVLFGKLDCIILVSAPWLVRLIRAKQRDKLPWTALLKRFSSQRHFNTQYMAKNADIFKVGNSGIGKPGLERRIDAILSRIHCGAKTEK